MHPHLERRMLAIHLDELQRLAGPARSRRLTVGEHRPAARNRPRVRAGLVLMRMGARLAKPALRPAPLPRQVLIGR
jgi:hypothetical protein